MRPTLALAAALMLIAPSAFAQTQQQDIDQAEHACEPASGWSSRAAYTVCLGTAERQVVVRYKPELAAVFDQFQQDRVLLAQLLDSGQITPTAYADTERVLEQHFLQDAKTSAAPPAPAEPQEADFTAPAPPAHQHDFSGILPALACLAASFSRMGSANAINVCNAAEGN